MRGRGMRRRLARSRIAWTVGLIGSALVAATVRPWTETTESVVLVDDLAADGPHDDATKKKPLDPIERN